MRSRFSVSFGGLITMAKLSPQRPSGNVFPVVCSSKADLGAGIIGSDNSSFQIRRPGCHSQDAPAGGVVDAVPFRRPGMEHLHSFHLVGIFEPVDSLALLKRTGVAPR